MQVLDVDFIRRQLIWLGLLLFLLLLNMFHNGRLPENLLQELLVPFFCKFPFLRKPLDVPFPDPVFFLPIDYTALILQVIQLGVTFKALLCEI